ncbi:MAG TPA: AAA family ATPase [Asticcacaulis sp.]|nr:AAA family ATPase [Asticcacaulis sp.]
MTLERALASLKDGADQVIETSCATVVLKGDRAYKLKKSVDYGFLDFTSADKRRTALERELQFNQRAAASIYREVTEIEGESVLVMRRFDTHAVLSERATPDWQPDMGLMQDLGETIAAFHAGAAVCQDETHARNIKYTIDSNAKHIALFRDRLGEATVNVYETAIQAAWRASEGDVRRRFVDGHIRQCHGDLHLGNILVEDGRPVLFDCIEFNDHLIQVDVLYDLAFLLMDLWVRDQPAAANRVFNAWLETAARREPDESGLYSGLKLLPLYLSARAGVRCHVSAHNGEIDKARLYLDAALAFLRPPPATLSAIGGLSGSGKSTVARQEAPAKGRPPGAVILRSDELRKRLWNCAPLDRLPPEAYAPEQSVRTHDYMFSLAETVLRAGQPVVLDATFREAKWRDRAEAMARIAGVAFDGLWLDVSAETRAARVDKRVSDVSDATVSVASAQEAVDPFTISWQIRRED